MVARGGTAKASSALHVSEDIFAGYTVCVLVCFCVCVCARVCACVLDTLAHPSALHRGLSIS